MAHNLQELMRDKTSSEKVDPSFNSVNASDIATVIREIKLYIEEIEAHQGDFERKINEENQRYKSRVGLSLERLRKLIRV